MSYDIFPGMSISWDVNIEMIDDIEPSIERSKEICRFGSALSESPKGMLGSGYH